MKQTALASQIREATTAAALLVQSAESALRLAPDAAAGNVAAIEKILRSADLAACHARTAAAAAAGAGATDTKSATRAAQTQASAQHAAQQARESLAGNDHPNASAWIAEALRVAALAAGDAANTIISLGNPGLTWPEINAATLAAMAAGEALQCAGAHIERHRILVDCQTARRQSIEAGTN